MLRWGWRLFRREWRQQLLILSSSSSPWPPWWSVRPWRSTHHHRPTPGTAPPTTWRPSPPAPSHPTCTLGGRHRSPRWSTTTARVQVIENETFNVPGSTQTYQLRSQDPHGPFGGPMLQLLSGQLPDRFRPGCCHPRAGVRAPPLDWRHVVRRAARPSSASCRTHRACWTSSPWCRPGRSRIRPK